MIETHNGGVFVTQSRRWLNPHDSPSFLSCLWPVVCLSERDIWEPYCLFGLQICVGVRAWACMCRICFCSASSVSNWKESFILKVCSQRKRKHMEWEGQCGVAVVSYKGRNDRALFLFLYYMLLFYFCMLFYIYICCLWFLLCWPSCVPLKHKQHFHVMPHWS